VVETTDLRRLLGDHQLIDIGIGEREERQRAAIGHAEERVAHRNIALEPRVVMPLAPGGDQRDAEQILEELPVGFLVAYDVRVMMQALREFG